MELLFSRELDFLTYQITDEFEVVLGHESERVTAQTSIFEFYSCQTQFELHQNLQAIEQKKTTQVRISAETVKFSHEAFCYVCYWVTH